MATGKCPYCQTLITSFEVEDVDAAVLLQPRWKGFAYLCPACRTVLSVQINPLTIRANTANELSQKVGRNEGLLAQILDLLQRQP